MSIKIEVSSNNHSCRVTPNSTGSSQVSDNAQWINNFARVPLGLNAREIEEMKQRGFELQLDDNVDFSSRSVQVRIQQYNELAQNYYNKKYTLVFVDLLNSGK